MKNEYEPPNEAALLILGTGASRQLIKLQFGLVGSGIAARMSPIAKADIQLPSETVRVGHETVLKQAAKRRVRLHAEPL